MPTRHHGEKRLSGLDRFRVRRRHSAHVQRSHRRTLSTKSDGTRRAKKDDFMTTKRAARCCCCCRERIEHTAQGLMQRHEGLEPHDPADECFVALTTDEGGNQHVLKYAISMQSACNTHADALSRTSSRSVALSRTMSHYVALSRRSAAPIEACSRGRQSACKEAGNQHALCRTE